MKSELELHIEQFPSNFDKTSIGYQLRDAGVSVRLYTEVRDVLWLKVGRFRTLKDRVESLVYDAKENLDDALSHLEDFDG